MEKRKMLATWFHSHGELVEVFSLGVKTLKRVVSMADPGLDMGWGVTGRNLVTPIIFASSAADLKGSSLRKGRVFTFVSKEFL